MVVEVVVGGNVVVVVVDVDVVVVEAVVLKVGQALPLVVVEVGILKVCKTGLSCSQRYPPGMLTHLKTIN